MDEQFIGVVNDFTNKTSLNFVVNSNVKLSLDDVIYVKKDDNYLLGIVKNMKYNFFLTDTLDYFTSLATSNDLEGLGKGRKPGCSSSFVADLIGEYKLVGDNLIRNDFSVNYFSSPPLQRVYLLQDNYYSKLIGTSDKGLNLGKVCYPRTLEGVFDPLIFDQHTLISGETRSGKSYLSTIIFDELGKDKKKIIIDPHREYRNRINDVEIIEENYFEKLDKLNDSKIIVDESYLLLKENPDKTINFLKEAGKRGNSVIMITQEFSDIPREIQSQFQNYFRFRDNKIAELKNLQNRICSVKLGLSPSFVLRTRDFY